MWSGHLSWSWQWWCRLWPLGWVQSWFQSGTSHATQICILPPRSGLHSCRCGPFRSSQSHHHRCFYFGVLMLNTGTPLPVAVSIVGAAGLRALDPCALASMSSLLCKSSIWSWRVRFWAAASLIFSSISTLHLSNSAFTWIDRACSTAICSSHCFFTAAIACCNPLHTMPRTPWWSFSFLHQVSGCAICLLLPEVHLFCCHRLLGLSLT